jgi:hypothetical protein
MTNALDRGYNEGRLAFRRYFAKYGPNVSQNDPGMPPNPYVGYYGVALRGSTGLSLNCAATSCLLQAPADSATSRSDFAFVECAERRLSSFCEPQVSRTTAASRSAARAKAASDSLFLSTRKSAVGKFPKRDNRGGPEGRNGFAPFAKPSANDRYLRKRDTAQSGWSRREAELADRDVGRRSWSDSAPLRVVSARTGVRAKAVIRANYLAIFRAPSSESTTV